MHRTGRGITIILKSREKESGMKPKRDFCLFVCFLPVVLREPKLVNEAWSKKRKGIRGPFTSIHERHDDEIEKVCPEPGLNK